MRIPYNKDISNKGIKLVVAIPTIIYCLLSLFFMSYIFINPFKDRTKFASNIIGLPKKWVLDNIIQAWQMGGFEQYLVNSILITGLSLFCMVFLSSLTSYGIARYSFKGQKVLYYYFLSSLMFPAAMFVVPLYLMMRNLHLTNTYAGVIIVYTASGMAFGILILTGFFRQLPGELAEAAKIDGAGEFRIYYKIMMPLAKPALATVAIFNSIAIWNDFFIVLVFIQDKAKKTLPVGMQTFFALNRGNWPIIFAGLLISTLPIIVVYLLGSNQLIKGLTSGAIKS